MGLLEESGLRSFSMIRTGDHAKLCFQAFGTNCEIIFRRSEEPAEQVKKEILRWVDWFEKRYSRFCKDNWLSKVNRNAGISEVEIHREDSAILDACQYAYFLSEGIVDPSLLPLVAIWDEARKENTLPSVHQIEKASHLVGWNKVIRSNDSVYLPVVGMGLDFGGFGKELAVDQVARMLSEYEVINFLVNFGGDVFAQGKSRENQTWKVGIEKTGGGEQPTCVVNLRNTGLATSGNYRKYFDLNGKRYGHLIDSRTGYPTLFSSLSCSVISPSCMKAGILSTACIMDGKKEAETRLERQWDSAGCLQDFDSHLFSSRFYNFL